MPLPLEIAVFSGQNGLNAQACGARRIELNAPGSYGEGGLTPPAHELTSIASQLNIPVRIMIRPRGPPAGGYDFIYTDAEFELMKLAIAHFKDTGVMNPVRGDAFVFGILKPADRRAASPSDPLVAVDTERCTILARLARPYGCVFHRAFDPIAATPRWSEGLDDLAACGFEGLLTAGGAGSYHDNLDRLDEICRRTAGKIQVVVGGGVRHHNVARPARQLARHEGSSVWVHSAALVRKEGRPFEEVDADELVKLVAALGLTFVD